MAEMEKTQHHHFPQSPDNRSFSLRVWPPSQRTRDVVINHLIDTLSSPSPLFSRYGTVSSDEAAANAKIIEEESFATADAAAAANQNEAEEDPCRGIEILQAYSKEISKKMLETVKTKASMRRDDAISSDGN